MCIIKRTFSDLSDTLAFFGEQKETDIWLRCPVSKLRVNPLKSTPVLAESLKDELGLTCTTEELVSAMAETKLYLSYDEEGIEKSDLLHKSAITGCFDRALIKGNIFKKLSLEDTAEILNKCFKAQKKCNALLLFREEKILAVHSGDRCDYSILPVADLLDAIIEELETKYPGYDMKHCEYTEDFTSALFELPDSGYKAKLNALLKKYGKETMDSTPMLSFITSDTGRSAAKLVAKFRTPYGEVIMGEPFMLHHKNKADIEKFREGMKRIYAIFNESTERIEKLLLQPIKNPKGCFLKVAKTFKLPKNQAFDAWEMAEFMLDEENTTAYDLYFSLWEIIDLLKKENASVEKLINIEEQIAKTLFINWMQYDRPFEWE